MSLRSQGTSFDGRTAKTKAKALDSFGSPGVECNSYIRSFQEVLVAGRFVTRASRRSSDLQTGPSGPFSFGTPRRRGIRANEKAGSLLPAPGEKLPNRAGQSSEATLAWRQRQKYPGDETGPALSRISRRMSTRFTHHVSTLRGAAITQ